MKDFVEILKELEECEDFEMLRSLLGRAAAVDLRLASVAEVFVAASSGSLTRWCECVSFLKSKPPVSDVQPCEGVPELLPIHPAAAGLAFGKLLFDQGAQQPSTFAWCMLALHGLNFFAAAGWSAKLACAAPSFWA
jgi:hypothetical protein